VIGEVVDMGADEFWATDFNRDGIVNFVDYAMLTSYWQDSGIDYNDVFLDGDSNSVGLSEFCDDWLWKADLRPGPMPLMAGRSGRGMAKRLVFEAASYELAAAKPVDIQKLLAWLAEIWLDPKVREVIGAEGWLKLYESLEKEAEKE
jgi:hypothetical protein